MTPQYHVYVSTSLMMSTSIIHTSDFTKAMQEFAEQCHEYSCGTEPAVVYMYDNESEDSPLGLRFKCKFNIQEVDPNE